MKPRFADEVKERVRLSFAEDLADFGEDRIGAAEKTYQSFTASKVYMDIVYDELCELCPEFAREGLV